MAAVSPQLRRTAWHAWCTAPTTSATPCPTRLWVGPTPALRCRLHTAYRTGVGVTPVIRSGPSVYQTTSGAGPEDRVLPGLRANDQAAICADCAGFSTSFRCSRCSEEGKLHGGRLCTRCTLSDRLRELLGDDSGVIRPELTPLVNSLLAAERPLSILTWLYTRKGKTESPETLMRQLGQGQIALTHEAFHTLQPWRAAAHLREFLMACGVLPRTDKQICSFERWLIAHLNTITDPDHGQLIQRFATWEVLPRLRARAANKPITPSGRRFAGEQITQTSGT